MAADKQGEGRVGRGITDHLYVDVDDTLFMGNGSGPVNWPLVEEIKKWYSQREAAGAEPCIVIWTMGGAAHAEEAMMKCDLDMGFRVVCIAKPDLMVDNGGHQWFYNKFRVVLPEAFKAPEVK